MEEDNGDADQVDKEEKDVEQADEGNEDIQQTPSSKNIEEESVEEYTMVNFGSFQCEIPSNLEGEKFEDDSQGYQNPESRTFIIFSGAKDFSTDSDNDEFPKMMAQAINFMEFKSLDNVTIMTEEKYNINDLNVFMSDGYGYHNNSQYLHMTAISVWDEDGAAASFNIVGFADSHEPIDILEHITETLKRV